jgi:hypothetical protein
VVNVQLGGVCEGKVVEFRFPIAGGNFALGTQKNIRGFLKEYLRSGVTSVAVLVYPMLEKAPIVGA